jgi:hypothetical protein
MKLNRITAVLFFLTVFVFTSISQVEDEEVQFDPSGTRNIGTKQVLDFGVLKKESKIIKIEVTNPGKADLTIGRIAIPEGVGVIVLKEVLKPGEKGEIAVLVDPKYMKSGEFKKEITITTHSTENGALITKSVTVNIKGQIL